MLADHRNGLCTDDVRTKRIACPDWATDTSGGDEPNVTVGQIGQELLLVSRLARKRLGKHERELLLLAAPSNADLEKWRLAQQRELIAKYAGRGPTYPASHRCNPDLNDDDNTLPGIVPPAGSARNRATRTLVRAGLVVKYYALQRYEHCIQITRTPLGDQVVAARAGTLKTNKRVRWAAALSTKEGA